MKGQTTFPEDYWWTIVLFIFAVVISLIALLLIGFGSLKLSGPGGYSIEFVNLASRPFFIGESLSFYNIEDRQFFEHALEIAIVKSTDSSASSYMPENLKSFMDAYKLNRYIIQINGGNRKLMTLDSSLRSCGDDSNNDNLPDGFCVQRSISKATTCGIGSLQIDDRGACGFTEICCKQVKQPEYEKSSERQKYDGIDIIQCDNGLGYCDVVTHGMNPQDSCGTARLYVNDKICETSNIGAFAGIINYQKAPVCCISKLPETLISSGSVSSGEIPLFYNDTSHFNNKNDAGSIEVIIP